MRVNTEFLRTKTLDEVMQEKKDIFTFIRLSAALLVLYAHSYHIFGLGSDPLTRKIGFYSGTLAVYIFFTISGFFIFQSAVKRTFVEYTIARVTRIFPGLIVANILTVVLIIPVAERFDYFSFVFNLSSWEFIKINSMLETVLFTLPDVFVNNPDHAINGSLWTLPVEVRAYIGAILVVALGVTASRGRYNAMFAIVVLMNSCFPAFLPVIFPIPGSVGLLYYFCIGGFFYVNRHYIPVSPLFTIAVLTILYFFRSFIEPLLIPFLIGYVIISSGYLLSILKVFAIKNDYSYGLYLYAYPVSQLSYSMLNQHGFIVYFLFILFATYAAAFFSWHFIEKPISYFARIMITPYLSTMVRKFHMINVRDSL